jgi:hypothetical protein
MEDEFQFDDPSMWDTENQPAENSRLRGCKTKYVMQKALVNPTSLELQHELSLYGEFTQTQGYFNVNRTAHTQCYRCDMAHRLKCPCKLKVLTEVIDENTTRKTIYLSGDHVHELANDISRVPLRVKEIVIQAIKDGMKPRQAVEKCRDAGFTIDNAVRFFLGYLLLRALQLTALVVGHAQSVLKDTQSFSS